MIRLARLATIAAAGFAAAILASSCSIGPDPSGTLIGHVYKEGTSQPIPGAIVQCGDFTATADTTGSYVIGGIVPGTNAVFASAQGYEDYSNVVTVGHLTTHDILMSRFVPKAHLFGTVNHAVEGPIAGAAVDLGGIVTTADSVGYYEYASIPQGTYQMTVTKPGYRTYSSSSFNVNSAECRRDIGLKKLAAASFSPLADASVCEALPDTNFGAATTLELLHNDFFQWRFVIHFPVSLPSSSEIVSATLTLTNVGPGGSGERTILVARALEPWDEMRITWNDSLETTGGTIAPGVYDAPTYEIDVTAHVAQWLGHANYGLGVDSAQEPDAASFSFASREHAAEDKRPVLTVDYAW